MHFIASKAEYHLGMDFSHLCFFGIDLFYVLCQYLYLSVHLFLPTHKNLLCMKAIGPLQHIEFVF